MIFFMLILSIFFKVFSTLYDYDDPIIRKRDLIIRSRICEYFNFLPICSETILYHPKPKRKICFNHFGIPYELSHSLHNRNYRQRWYNPDNYEPKHVCNYCRCPRFSKRHYLMPYHDYHMHICNYRNNWKHKFKKSSKFHKNKR